MCFFGKSSVLDPLGITTSKAADPLGVTKAVNDVPEKVVGKKVADPVGVVAAADSLNLASGKKENGSLLGL